MDMKRKSVYIRPLTEQVNVKLSCKVLWEGNGLNIPISGGMTPEESDAKPFVFDDEDEDYNFGYPSQRNLWED